MPPHLLKHKSIPNGRLKMTAHARPSSEDKIAIVDFIAQEMRETEKRGKYKISIGGHFPFAFFADDKTFNLDRTDRVDFFLIARKTFSSCVCLL